MAKYNDCEVRYPSHQDDVKGYDTEKLREHFLVEKMMVPGEVKMVYSMFDRMIAGGVMPIDTTVKLNVPEILRADYFTERREIGIINTGAEGRVIVDDEVYELKFIEALYIGSGEHVISFESVDPKNPAMFYFNSAVAHTSYPTTKVDKSNAIVMELGSMEESNHRIINRMIVKEVIPTCQLQMGITELLPGSVWNTMPAHTHDRRMEIYYYFDIAPSQAVCHFMGEPQQTRPIWMKGGDAVISPVWSIHSACATSNYRFIWGMGGENHDYTDMDTVAVTDLK